MEINQTFYNKEKMPVLVTLIENENFRSSLMIENITCINAELFENILQIATFVATTNACDILNRVGMNLSYDGIMTGFDNQEMTYHVSFPWISVPLKVNGIETEIRDWHFLSIPELLQFLETNLHPKKSEDS